MTPGISFVLHALPSPEHFPIVGQPQSRATCR
jgi:hypothetical protein